MTVDTLGNSSEDVVKPHIYTVLLLLLNPVHLHETRQTPAMSPTHA